MNETLQKYEDYLQTEEFAGDREITKKMDLRIFWDIPVWKPPEYIYPIQQSRSRQRWESSDFYKSLHHFNKKHSKIFR